jgi:hypothetical protein
MAIGEMKMEFKRQIEGKNQVETSASASASTLTWRRRRRFAFAALAIAGAAGCSSNPASSGGTGGTPGTGGGAGGALGTGGASDGAASDGAPGGIGGLVVPAALEPPAGTALAQHLHAIGAQVYTCTASGGGDAGATTYAWVLKAPDAKLYDASGTQVASHSAGPTWTSTVDGSAVVGAKIAQADSPLADAIPWLLLRAASTSGSGVFSDVTFVQRVNTVKGKAPATGCDATTAATDDRVDYEADYYFYTGATPLGLELPAGATLLARLRGIGAQVYTCASSAGTDGGATTYAWALKAPDAKLFDAAGVQVGTHSVGPTWTSTVDGSAVVGTKIAQIDSPLADAISWLLLRAASTSGAGTFTGVSYVHRVNTSGGKAPATGCDSAASPTAEKRVDYQADYYFYQGGAAGSDGGTDASGG